MNTVKPRLALVLPVGARANLAGPLQRTLEKLGFAVEVVDQDAAFAASKIAAAVIPWESRLGQATDAIEACVSKVKGIPTLGILKCDPSAEEIFSFDQFDEIVTHPYHERELAIRLGRIGAFSRIRDPLNWEPTREAFAGLNLVGRSPRFLETLRLTKKFAQFSAPVLIQGPTGTGKELIARALHYLGARRNNPFVPVNCGAIPDNLLENELFGHERGAFTDAKEAQAGLVAQAHGGTLLLDELETLSARAQVALLRFLQDFEYRPLGGKRIKKADVRIVAATNANLRALVDRGGFREDLFFRISVVNLAVPSLNERPGDIELLAHHFVRRFGATYGHSARVLEPEVLDWMNGYPWPGNVRELENFVHRAVVACGGATIGLEDCLLASGLPDGSEPQSDGGLMSCNFTEAKAKVVEAFELRYLRRLMSLTGGNVTRAATLAGKDRRAFGRMLKRYGIEREDYITPS